MTNTWRAGLVVLAATAWHMSPALAQGETKGDAEAGRIKASTCMGCHGIASYRNVYPTFNVPKLGGQHEAYIQSSLEAYRSGKRSHPTMQGQAASLSDQDIADISAFLANAPQE
mgnify:FL=1